MIEIALNKDCNVVITSDQPAGQVIMNRYEWNNFLEGVRMGAFDYFTSNGEITIVIKP